VKGRRDNRRLPGRSHGDNVHGRRREEEGSGSARRQTLAELGSLIHSSRQRRRGTLPPLASAPTRPGAGGPLNDDVTRPPDARVFADAAPPDLPYDKADDTITQAPAPSSGSLTDKEDLLLVYVTARGDRAFTGTEIEAALESAGLRRGALDIFHCCVSVENTQAMPSFSVANMYEPGTLSAAELPRLRTGGLVFFLRLPHPDGVESLARMLEGAHTVARQLGGELSNSEGDALTPEGIQQLHRYAEQACRPLPTAER